MSGIVAARILGPAGRGELAAIQGWPSFLATMAMLGLPEALVYGSARWPERSARLLASAILLALLACVPFAGLGYIGMPLFLHSQPPLVIRAARLYLLLLPIYATSGMLYHPLQGLGKFAVWNTIRLLPGVSWLALLGVAALLGHRSATFLSNSNLIVLAALLVPVTAVVRGRLRGRFQPSVSDWPWMLRYGLPCVSSSLPRTFNLRLDQLLMAAMVAPSVLGLYAVAVTWSTTSQFAVSSLGRVLFPGVASITGAGEQRVFLSRMCRIAAALSIVTCVCMLALTPKCLPLIFGSKFEAAVPTTLVLIVAGCVNSVVAVLEDGLRGVGRPSAVLIGEGAGMCVTVVLLPLLLRTSGMMGAAVASLMAYAAIAAVLLLSLRRETGGTVKDFMFVDRDDLDAIWRHARGALYDQAKRFLR